MFRKVRFPLPTIEKVNIEYHLDWLLRRFGESPIHEHQTLTVRSPELTSFVTKAGLDRVGIQQMIENRFPFDCSGCELIDWDGQAEVPPDPDIILLNPNEQVNPEAMINRIACHISRRFLASMDTTELEHADLTDLSELMTVYFGLGVFGANMALQTTQYTHGEWHYWQHQKYTDSAARHFGVALAYMSWIRNDPEEKLARALRPDARVPFQRALKYLQRTNDSLFDAATNTSVFAMDQVQLLEPLLENASVGQTVGVLQRMLEIAEPGTLSDTESASFLYQRLPELLRSPDDSVRMLACLAADRFGTVNADVLDGLKDLLSDPVPEIRKEATLGVIYLAPSGQLLARDLVISLKDEDSGVVEAAVKGLLFLQQQDEDVVPELLTLIRKGLNMAGGVSLSFLFGALDTVSADAESHISDFLKSDPQELRTALHYIRDWREQARQTDDAEGVQ